MSSASSNLNDGFRDNAVLYMKLVNQKQIVMKDLAVISKKIRELKASLVEGMLASNVEIVRSKSSGILELHPQIRRVGLNAKNIPLILANSKYNEMSDEIATFLWQNRETKTLYNLKVKPLPHPLDTVPSFQLPAPESEDEEDDE